jgi:transcriptional regulator with XRE-family HTH domain
VHFTDLTTKRRAPKAKVAAAGFTLATIVRRARQRRGLTQVDLADRANVAQSCVARWENERVPMMETTLLKVADALDLSLRDLILLGIEDAEEEGQRGGGRSKSDANQRAERPRRGRT